MNLAVIPDVAADARTPRGALEEFVWRDDETSGQRSAHRDQRSEDRGQRSECGEQKSEDRNQRSAAGIQNPEPGIQHPAAASGFTFHVSRFTREASRATYPLAENPPLVRYLQDNPGFHVIQHGCHHDPFEFDLLSRPEAAELLELGTARLVEAGLPRPETFVAPHDKLSRPAYQEVSHRFRVLSTGWFEWRRLPASWWLRYGFKKFRRSPHWRSSRTLLLSHPGCLLSCHRQPGTILESIIYQIKTQRLTVLVTHWWEYFRQQRLDDRFIAVLHETADYLAKQREIRVISFADLIHGSGPRF
ncbi:MAG: hypothetical protein C5B50_12590 [Verrucomicrobia bacterium]|nr:MAG: hypothetical protein C5B50_12590 [Verrucomicrobiota bacterium]